MYESICSGEMENTHFVKSRCIDLEQIYSIIGFNNTARSLLATRIWVLMATLVRE